MVSAQNIQDVRFSSAMSGYKKAEVDAFLDQCAATIEELNNTIEENTRKMQVLAETIVEYRNQEDSIRSAVLGAQRLSETVVEEATVKAQAIVAEAEGKAQTIIAEAEEKASHVADEAMMKIKAETEELARLKKEVAAFRSRLLATYREHLTLIGVLNEDDKTPVSVSQPIEQEPVAPAVEEAPVMEIEPVAETVPAVAVPDEAPAVPVENTVKFDISAFRLDDLD